MVSEQEIREALEAGKTFRQIREELHVNDRRIKKVRDALQTKGSVALLEARLTALQDSHNALAGKLKDAQRERALADTLVDALAELVKPLSPPKKLPLPKQAEIHESCVMHLSDIHADLVVHPEQVGGLEKYDFGIALVRAEKYVERLIKFTQRTLNNYCFDELWVLAYGDFVHGEIHDATQHNEYKNIFKSCLAAARMQSLMLRDLCEHFPRINVLYLPGNHGRRLHQRKKPMHAPTDNWDYLVGKTTELLCASLPNVTFAIPNAYSAIVNIQGFNFAVAHGDDVKSWNGIPHYGLERRTRRMTALHALGDTRIDYHCYGHFHQASTVAALDGETIVNGSFVGTDPYVYNALGGYTRPSQWCHGVHAKHGVSWRLKIDLKVGGEPTRYAEARL